MHGDAGRSLDGDVTADDLVVEMMGRLLDDGEFSAGDEVCVLLNNAGAMTLMELSVMSRSVLRCLDETGIAVHRCGSGRTPRRRTLPDLRCRSAASTPGCGCSTTRLPRRCLRHAGTRQLDGRPMNPSTAPLDGDDFAAMAVAMADAVNDNAGMLSSLDAVSGDGDHGANVQRAMTRA